MMTYKNFGFEHLFPYSRSSDFVLKRTMDIRGKNYSVIVLGNYMPYSGITWDAWGLAIVVDAERIYLGGGHNTFHEAFAAARGAFATLMAIKQEGGEAIDITEDDIVNFVLTRGEISGEIDGVLNDLRRETNL